jgi:hypothetical protein
VASGNLFETLQKGRSFTSLRSISSMTGPDRL